MNELEGSAINPGQEIGRFRIEKKLGEGGNGSVYLAKDLSLSRQIAIKFLNIHKWCQDTPRSVQKEIEQRFIREATWLNSVWNEIVATWSLKSKQINESQYATWISESRSANEYFIRLSRYKAGERQTMPRKPKKKRPLHHVRKEVHQSLSRFSYRPLQ